MPKNLDYQGDGATPATAVHFLNVPYLEAIRGQYAWLKQHGLRSRGQSLMRVDGQFYDVHAVGEGREVWFKTELPT